MIDDNITIVINTFKSEDKIFNCLDSINAFCKVIIIENSKSGIPRSTNKINKT